MKDFRDFEILKKENIVFNSSVFIDLTNFNQMQMKECMTMIYFLPIYDLNIKFTGTVNDITLLLSQNCKKLNLCFS